MYKDTNILSCQILIYYIKDDFVVMKIIKIKVNLYKNIIHTYGLNIHFSELCKKLIIKFARFSIPSNTIILITRFQTTIIIEQKIEIP
jgi:hypothetical protein